MGLGDSARPFVVLSPHELRGSLGKSRSRQSGGRGPLTSPWKEAHMTWRLGVALVSMVAAGGGLTAARAEAGPVISEAGPGFRVDRDGDRTTLSLDGRVF